MAQDSGTQHALEQDSKCVVHCSSNFKPSVPRRTLARHWGDSSLVTMAQHVIARSLLTVSKPAPDWNGTAVVNRDFVELKLSDFKGIRHSRTLTCELILFILPSSPSHTYFPRSGLNVLHDHGWEPRYHRKVFGFLFLST